MASASASTAAAQSTRIALVYYYRHPLPWFIADKMDDRNAAAVHPRPAVQTTRTWPRAAMGAAPCEPSRTAGSRPGVGRGGNNKKGVTRFRIRIIFRRYYRYGWNGRFVMKDVFLIKTKIGRNTRVTKTLHRARLWTARFRTYYVRALTRTNTNLLKVTNCYNDRRNNNYIPSSSSRNVRR